MNSNTCMATTSLPMQPGSCIRTYNSHITQFFCRPKTLTSLNVKKFSVLSRWEQTPARGPTPKKYLVSDQMIGRNLVPTFPRCPRCPTTVPKTSKDVPYSFRYPQMTKKPQWFWRTLACIPYLMPLHETWMYAETAYHLHPFLEDFEFLTYPFLGFIGQLPSWFLMAYFFAAYLGVVILNHSCIFYRPILHDARIYTLLEESLNISLSRYCL